MPQDLALAGPVNYGWVIVKWRMGPREEACEEDTQDRRHGEQGDPCEMPNDEFERVPSRSRRMLRSVSKTLSVASTTLIGVEVDALDQSQCLHYSHCQVMIDGKVHAATREIRWDKEARTHAFQVSVEVGQVGQDRTSRTVAVRVQDARKNVWTEWSEALAVDLTSVSPVKNKRHRKPRKTLNPELPSDFYRNKLKGVRWKRKEGTDNLFTFPAGNANIARSQSAPGTRSHGHLPKDALGKSLAMQTVQSFIHTSNPTVYFCLLCAVAAVDLTHSRFCLNAGMYKQPKFISWRSSKVQPLPIPECEPNVECDHHNDQGKPRHKRFYERL